MLFNSAHWEGDNQTNLILSEGTAKVLALPERLMSQFPQWFHCNSINTGSERANGINNTKGDDSSNT